MKTNQLTTRKVATAKKPGHYGDGSGLYLQVSKFGTKSWVFRFMVDGVTREMGLGSLNTFTLKGARERARECRQLLNRGEDPIDARKLKKTEARKAKAARMTFRQCAADYQEEHAASWKNKKHREQWASTIERANKAFGDLDVAAIDVSVLAKFLSPMWRETPETASRLRGRIEAVLGWATVRGFRQGDNPARWRGHLEHLLAARQKGKHHSALPYTDLPAFMAELHKRDSVSARAIEFTILTAARTGEVVGAVWEEIDRKEKTWTIPAERMKSGREHRVPLSDRVVELLGTPQSSGLIFQPIRPRMRDLLAALNPQITLHGFRSSFRDWAAEHTNFPREVCEMALAHSIGDKVEAAYRRGDLFKKRRSLMAAWARYCSSPAQVSGSVVPMHVAS
jgi:integrase